MVSGRSGWFYLVDGTVASDLNREFEWSLPDDEASTVAGLVLFNRDT